MSKKKDISNSFNIVKNKLNERKNFSKTKIKESWGKYKEEGVVLFNRDKS